MSATFPSRPATGVPRPYHFPEQQRRSLPCGAHLVVAPLHRVPLVSVVLAFQAAGADADPPGAEGLAALTAALLVEGSATRTGQALTDAIELLGSSLSTSADWDAATVSFTVQPRHLDAVIELVADVIRAPAFPDAELARLQGEHASDRLQALTEPRTLADLATQWCVYDAASRYRRSIGGTTASVAALNVDAVRTFWRTRYTPGTLTVVVTGDIDVPTAERVATRLVEGWEVSEPERGALTTAPRQSSPTLHLVHRPDAPQSELRVARIAVPRVHPAFFANTLMNAIFGGLFSSRINLNLRERNGYTYGAHAGFDWRRSAGPWAASTAVGTDVTAAAARELLNEVRTMRETRVSADELSLATSFLTGVFPLRFESTQAVAGALASQAILGLPLSYYDTYRDAISSITADEIHAASVAHFDVSLLQLIVVGDIARVRADLEALDFGPVVEHRAEKIEEAP